MSKAPLKPANEKPGSTPKSSSSPAKRESEQQVFNHLKDWANSPGLQPPK